MLAVSPSKVIVPLAPELIAVVPADSLAKEEGFVSACWYSAERNKAVALLLVAEKVMLAELSVGVAEPAVIAGLVPDVVSKEEIEEATEIPFPSREITR